MVRSLLGESGADFRRAAWVMNVPGTLGSNGCPPLIDEEITRRVTKHMRMGIDIQAGSQQRARCRP